MYVFFYVIYFCYVGYHKLWLHFVKIFTTSLLQPKKCRKYTSDLFMIFTANWKYTYIMPSRNGGKVGDIHNIKMLLDLL